MSKSPSKKWSFKSHHVPTAQWLQWFRESRGYSWTPQNEEDRYVLFFLLEEFDDFGCHFGAHWILKGVPKSIIFEKIEENKKDEVQEAGWKKHDFSIVFNANWEAWNGKKKVFAYIIRIIYVAKYEFAGSCET